MSWRSRRLLTGKPIVALFSLIFFIKKLYSVMLHYPNNYGRLEVADGINDCIRSDQNENAGKRSE